MNNILKEELPDGCSTGNSLSKPSQLWKQLMNETSERWSNNFYTLGEITNRCVGLLSMEEVKSFDPLFFSNIFDFHGSSITIDTACSSSSNAVVLGCKSIIDGSSKMSIVGGTSLILEGMCKSFDADADGYVRSECIGVLFLKDLKQAIIDGDRVYFFIKGNVDGNGYADKLNFYSPSAQSQAENIKMALSSANTSNVCIILKHLNYNHCSSNSIENNNSIDLKQQQQQQ
ncbi:hypothetical protein ACTFIV_000324 [Dictyostelium citrinum]